MSWWFMVVSHCWRSIRFFQANESPQSQKDTKPKAFHWPSPQQWWNKCVWIIPLNKKNLSYLKKLFFKKKVHNSASQCVFCSKLLFGEKQKCFGASNWGESNPSILQTPGAPASGPSSRSPNIGRSWLLPSVAWGAGYGKLRIPL